MQVHAAVAVIVLAVVASAQAGVVGVVPSTTLVRTPSLDSSITHSARVGDSFAYSTAENHAYAAVSPVLETVVAPVGLSYAAAVPAYTAAAAAVAAPLDYEPTVVIAK